MVSPYLHITWPISFYFHQLIGFEYPKLPVVFFNKSKCITWSFLVKNDDIWLTVIFDRDFDRYESWPYDNNDILRALEWARHCKNQKQSPPFRDPFWGSLGENRWISSSANLEPERAVDLWWSERKHYNIMTDMCKKGKQCDRYKQVNTNASPCLPIQYIKFH